VKRVRQFSMRSVLVLMVALLVACHSGGSDVNTISGVAAKGPISGATVRVRSFDAGLAGAILGTGTTNAKGEFSVAIDDNYGGSIIVEVSGGSYRDEITANTTALATPLHAMCPSVSGGASVMVTPLTEEAYQYALATYASSLNATSLDAANKKISSYFGFDIITTVPVDPASPAFASASQTSQNYALALTRFAGGGMSRIASDITDYTDNGRFDGISSALDQINAYLASAANATGISDLTGTYLSKAASLQSLLDAVIANTAYQVPGVALAVQEKDGFVWSGASGVANRTTGEPITPAHHFRIGSISKTFTAVLILRYAQEGKLSLDDPVSKWMPELTAKLPKFDFDQIKIRNLLNHTSGIPTYTGFDDPIFGLSYIHPTTVWEPDEIYAVIGKYDPEFAPGTSWDYSNSNYYLLGRIADKVSGSNYEKAIAAHLLGPLGLKHTSVPMPGEPTMTGLYAHGYSNLKGTGLKEFSVIDPSYPYAAGAVISTVGDLNIWGREIALGGTILNSTYQAEHLTYIDLATVNAPGYKYGLGIMLEEADNILGHRGQIFGFDCTVQYALDYDTVLSACVNRELFDPDAENFSNTNLLVVYDALDLLFPKTALTLSHSLKAIGYGNVLGGNVPMHEYRIMK